MTDIEFTSKVYIGLLDEAPDLEDVPLKDNLFNILFDIIKEVRAVEREELTKRMWVLEKREDLHPVCKY